MVHKRGTRAQIDAAATANQLRLGEIYLVTDEGRLTVGTAVNTHVPHAKQGEVGGAVSSLTTVKTETDFLNKNVAQGGFQGAAISAGTNSSSVAVAALAPNHPGIWVLRSSTTANSGYLCLTAAELRIGGGEVFDLVFRIATLTGTTARFGLLDTQTSADAIDGCYFELAATGVIIGKTSANSVRSSTPTLATLVANTWYHARLTVNATATSVLFEVFGETGTLLGSASLTTNIPTASGRETQAGFVVTNSGTVASDLVFADFMRVQIGRTLTRGAAG